MRARELLACAVVALACAGRPPAPAPEPEAPVPNAAELRRHHEERASPAPAASAAGGVNVSRTGTAKFPSAGGEAAISAEMERRRAAALARGEAARRESVDALDEEIAQDEAVEQIERRRLQHAAMQGSLRKAGPLATTGCYAQLPELAADGDLSTHRTLRTSDFRSPKRSEQAKPVVKMPGAEVGAYVALRIGCVMQTEAAPHPGGGFEVRVKDVRYVAFMSRDNSWWNPKSDEHGLTEWVLRHEQLHFDIAELLAQDWTAKLAQTRETTRGVARTAEEAMVNFQVNWVAHLETVDDELHRIEVQYDRETRHGTDYAEQTRWFEKVKRGLAQVRAGLPRAGRASLEEAALGLR